MTEQELDLLLTEYGGTVRTICRGILPGRQEDSEEAEADTFVKLWRSRKLPADKAHLRSYVIRTARSCAVTCTVSPVRFCPNIFRCLKIPCAPASTGPRIS